MAPRHQQYKTTINILLDHCYQLYTFAKQDRDMKIQNMAYFNKDACRLPALRQIREQIDITISSLCLLIEDLEDVQSNLDGVVIFAITDDYRSKLLDFDEKYFKHRALVQFFARKFVTHNHSGNFLELY